MTATNFIYLIIDDRERAIIQHETELTDIKWVKKRIYTGDYAVARGRQLLAVFERKTYEDFAASLKDGRHHNKNNLISARDKYGCSIYYIIEGPLLPRPNETFAKFPYYVIESAIDHLIIRDKFNVIYTRDSQHTAMRLCRFVQSMINLYAGGKNAAIEPPADVIPNMDPEPAGPIATCCPPVVSPPDPSPSVCTLVVNEKQDAPAEESVKEAGGPADDSMTAVLNKTAKSDRDIVREMWAQIKGISVVSADIFMSKFTIGDLMRSIPREQLAAVCYANGRRISDKLVGRLLKIDRLTEIKLLATIPGISRIGATQLLEGIALRALISYDVGAISIRQVNGKKLGIAKAERIKKYFEYK